jgi:hypothetical protein
MKKLREAVKWMWDHCGQDIWWKPHVLTSKNTDPTAPRLTLVEAKSVFRLLEDEKLIFPIQLQDRSTAYLINEVKEKEWGDFLKAINPFNRWVVRPLVRLFTKFWIVIIWFTSVVIAAAVGGFFSAWIQSLFDGK